MKSVEIISIGSELLSGDVLDTNSQFIAISFKELGLLISRITLVQDNIKDISQAVKEAIQRSDIIISTGGLGPTIDDATRDAIALATGQDLIFIEDLWKQINLRFELFNSKPTENNRQQAFIPRNAVPISNPVGTAPAFLVEIKDQVIISLPGVPHEMKHLITNEVIPYLCEKYVLDQVIITKTIHTADVGESFIDNLINKLDISNNIEIGVFAKPGLVDIKLITVSKSHQDAERVYGPVIQILNERLGEHIFGYDNETLHDIVSNRLTGMDLSLEIYETGFEGLLSKKISNWHFSINKNEVLNSSEFQHYISNRLKAADTQTIRIFAQLLEQSENYFLEAYIQFPKKIIKLTKYFPGSLERCIQRSLVSILNSIRINL